MYNTIQPLDTGRVTGGHMHKQSLRARADGLPRHNLGVRDLVTSCEHDKRVKTKSAFRGERQLA